MAEHLGRKPHEHLKAATGHLSRHQRLAQEVAAQLAEDRAQAAQDAATAAPAAPGGPSAQG